jgi:hypothetical protein
MLCVKRRKFITLLVSAAAGWPLGARAQQIRRIGVMIALPEGDPELKRWIEAFRQGLEKVGWSEGGNVQIDYRFAPAGVRAPEHAKERLALRPDVILAFSTPRLSCEQGGDHAFPRRQRLCGLRY